MNDGPLIVQSDKTLLLEVDHAIIGDSGRPDLDEHLAWHSEIARRLWDLRREAASAT